MIIRSGPIKLGTAQLLPLKSQHTIHSNYKFWLTPAKVGKAGGLAKLERKNFAICAREVSWYLLELCVFSIFKVLLVQKMTLCQIFDFKLFSSFSRAFKSCWSISISCFSLDFSGAIFLSC